nr:MAG TPA: hypothetical protein [Caudoviricetes sp.]
MNYFFHIFYLKRIIIEKTFSKGSYLHLVFSLYDTII